MRSKNFDCWGDPADYDCEYDGLRLCGLESGRMKGLKLRWFRGLRSRYQRSFVECLIADGDRAKQRCDWELATSCYRIAIDRYCRVLQHDRGWLTARDQAEVLI